MQLLSCLHCAKGPPGEALEGLVPGVQRPPVWLHPQLAGFPFPPEQVSTQAGSMVLPWAQQWCENAHRRALWSCHGHSSGVRMHKHGLDDLECPLLGLTIAIALTWPNPWFERGWPGGHDACRSGLCHVPRVWQAMQTATAAEQPAAAHRSRTECACGSVQGLHSPPQAFVPRAPRSSASAVGVCSQTLCVQAFLGSMDAFESRGPGLWAAAGCQAKPLIASVPACLDPHTLF